MSEQVSPQPPDSSEPSSTQTPKASDPDAAQPPTLTGSAPAPPTLTGSASPPPHAPSKKLAMLIAGVLTLLVMGVLFPNLWYGIADLTDLPLYHRYAERIAAGESPFTSSFKVEYPPLAVALFRVPGHTDDKTVYGVLFAALMGAITVATGAVTAYVACRLWPRGGGPTSPPCCFPSASRSSAPS